MHFKNFYGINKTDTSNKKHSVNNIKHWKICYIEEENFLKKNNLELEIIYNIYKTGMLLISSNIYTHFKEIKDKEFDPCQYN